MRALYIFISIFTLSYPFKFSSTLSRFPMSQLATERGLASGDIAAVNNMKHVVLFQPNTLRIHDNPCLRVLDHVNSNNLEFVYVHDEEYIKGLQIIDKTRRNARIDTTDGLSDEHLLSNHQGMHQLIIEALEDVNCSLNNKLTQLSGESSAALLSYLLSIGASKDIQVIMCQSDIEPLSSINKRVAGTLLERGYSVKLVHDHLTENLNLNERNDLVYNKYKSIYSNRNIPRPMLTMTSILPEFSVYPSDERFSSESQLAGESRALSLLREYINLGDQMFTIKYHEEYINSISSSRDVYKSLKRLITPQDSSLRNSVVTRRSSFFYGEVFSGLLSPYISLGCISPRLLYWARSLSRYLGRPSLSVERPLFCRLKEEAIRRDWHNHLAKWTSGSRDINKDISSTAMANRWSVRFSNWNGYLQRELLPADIDPRKPNIVFVHGFGGSIQQNMDICANLSDEFNCFAIDMLGFGFSEKPPLSYNQYVWRDQVNSFLISISQLISSRDSVTVKEQNKEFYIAGNSIGGYISASVVASDTIDHSESSDMHIKGLILMNSAGQIYKAAEYDNINRSPNMDSDLALYPTYMGPSPHVLQGIGIAIFSALQPNIRKLCEWLYPTAKDRVSVSRNNGEIADMKGVDPQRTRSKVDGLGASLVDAIYRDSCDLGASDVIASGAKLPPSTPMNDLLTRKYSGGNIE